MANTKKTNTFNPHLPTQGNGKVDAKGALCPQFIREDKYALLQLYGSFEDERPEGERHDRHHGFEGPILAGNVMYQPHNFHMQVMEQMFPELFDRI